MSSRIRDKEIRAPLGHFTLYVVNFPFRMYGVQVRPRARQVSKREGYTGDAWHSLTSLVKDYQG